MFSNNHAWTYCFSCKWLWHQPHFFLEYSPKTPCALGLTRDAHFFYLSLEKPCCKSEYLSSLKFTWRKVLFLVFIPPCHHKLIQRWQAAVLESSSGGAWKFSDQFLEVAGLKLKYAGCSTGKSILWSDAWHRNLVQFYWNFLRLW
jgi:hypothetical protein